MNNSTCECPKCGGLPLDPRVVNVESDALFHVAAGAGVFSYPGERDLDWALERELNAPEQGLITLTCFDCEHRWSAEAPAPDFDRDATFNRAAALANADRFDEALDLFDEILKHDPVDVDALEGCTWCAQRSQRHATAAEKLAMMQSYSTRHFDLCWKFEVIDGIEHQVSLKDESTRIAILDRDFSSDGTSTL